MNLEGQVVQVNLDDIIPNRFQPRIAFDEKALNELASSIKEHGIIQPLVLRKLGKKYEIIAGERRYKASQLAGLTTVPAVISNIDDNSSAEVALVENIQRRDLTPIEEARSYKNLLDKGYLTQEQLAKKMGLSQSSISNKLRLLNLDNQVQQALLDGKISERHARSLLTLPNKEDQVTWLNKIVEERITVRDLDKRLKEFLNKSEEKNDIPLVDLTPNIEEIKNNAVDINNNKPKNIANLLVSEDTMTEYSDNLPTNPVNNVQPESTPVESLDAPVESLDAPQAPVETPQSDILQPFANTFNEPKDVDNAPIENNKFFNPLEDEPVKLDDLSAFANEGIFNIDNTPATETLDTKSGVEIFDVAPEKIETLEAKAPVETLENPSIINELNPNNKFFQPVNKPLEEIAPVEQLKEETLINPMDYVDQLEVGNVPTNNTQVSATQNNNANNAINDIKVLINSLKMQGLNITMDETDLENKHQIIIQIEK